MEALAPRLWKFVCEREAETCEEAGDTELVALPDEKVSTLRGVNVRVFRLVDGARVRVTLSFGAQASVCGTWC